VVTESPFAPSPCSFSSTTSAEYVQAWLAGLYRLLQLASSPSVSASSSPLPFFIPFVFIHLNEDEENKEAFRQGRELVQLAREYPAIGCIGVSPSDKLEQKYLKKAKEKVG
jgi:hypothetical protein